MSAKEEKLLSRIYDIINSGKPANIKYNKTVKYVNKSLIKKLKDEKEKQGGILPLAALLPLIFGGVAAAGTTAGTVASIVNNVQSKNEQARHNAAMERLAAKEKEGGCLNSDNVSTDECICSDSEESLIDKIKDAIALLKSVGFHFV